MQPYYINIYIFIYMYTYQAQHDIGRRHRRPWEGKGLVVRQVLRVLSTHTISYIIYILYTYITHDNIRPSCRSGLIPVRQPRACRVIPISVSKVCGPLCVPAHCLPVCVLCVCALYVVVVVCCCGCGCVYMYVCVPTHRIHLSGMRSSRIL